MGNTKNATFEGGFFVFMSKQKFQFKKNIQCKLDSRKPNLRKNLDFLVHKLKNFRLIKKNSENVKKNRDCVLLYWRHLSAWLLYIDFAYTTMLGRPLLSEWPTTFSFFVLLVNQVGTHFIVPSAFWLLRTWVQSAWNWRYILM